MNNYQLFQDVLMSRKEAAKYLGLKENTLAIWAMTKRHSLPYLKIGRLVKYRLSDLQAFLEKNLCAGE